jgi:hypothetical protein
LLLGVPGRAEIDPHYHLLGWFGDNTRMIDFLADLLFNAFADSERSVAWKQILNREDKLASGYSLALIGTKLYILSIKRVSEWRHSRF